MTNIYIKTHFNYLHILLKILITEYENSPLCAFHMSVSGLGHLGSARYVFGFSSISYEDLASFGILNLLSLPCGI